MAKILKTLKKTVGKAFKSQFLDAKVIRTEDGTSTEPWNPGATTPPIDTEYACKAIREEYQERFVLDGTVKATDRKFLVLADTLSIVPQEGDRFSLEGSPEIVIQKVRSDPATACWELHCGS